METYRLSLGQLVFSIDGISEEVIDPTSRRAQQLAESLASELNRRLGGAVLEGKMPSYALHTKVIELRTGSLLTYLGIVVDVTDVVFGAVVGGGLYAFLKDYPSVKKGILEVAHDVNRMVVRSYWIARKAYRVAVTADQLQSESQLTLVVQKAHAEIEQELRARATRAAQSTDRETARSDRAPPLA